MRTLILSDLHANAEATEAVLRAARGIGYDRTFVLGDLAGYGADPGAVVAAVRALPELRIVRVPYAIASARSKIQEAGLPPWLGDRLLLGV